MREQRLTEDEFLPEFMRKEVLVLGCGNVLFGDDGFGPEVAEMLKSRFKRDIPENVCVLNVGTGARNILFNVCLSPTPPRKVIIVDAVDAGLRAGEVFEIDLDAIPARKVDDFSMHQVPTSNLLKELREEKGVEVRVLCCQVARIPEEVSPGLSSPVKEAIEKACRKVIEMVKEG